MFLVFGLTATQTLASAEETPGIEGVWFSGITPIDCKARVVTPNAVSFGGLNMLSHDGSFDGLALDLRDNVYAAANIQNKIVRVARDGSITTIAAAPADPLVFPSAIAFETSFGLQKRIYITNFAGPAAVLFTAHNTTLSFEDASIKEMTVIIGGQKVVLGPGSLGYVPRNTVHEFKVTGKQVCHCLNYYTPAGFEQALLGCSRPAERRELPPPGLDPPDSPHVVRFFNNYWCAPASLLWATQKWSRG